jgi:hypothetical protein
MNFSLESISRFIVSKKGNTPDPKKIEALGKMSTPGDSSFQWNGPILQMFH